jgi:hypothetical protein
MPECGLLLNKVFKGVHTLFLITALLRIFMAGLALPGLRRLKISKTTRHSTMTGINRKTMVDGGGGYNISRKKDRVTPSGPESGALGQDLLHEACRGSFIITL